MSMEHRAIIEALSIKVNQLKNAGLTTSEIARRLKIDERTVRELDPWKRP